jgi:hypothetical protein
MGTARIALVSVAVMVCGAASAGAQTADAIFSGWDFRAAPVGSRPAGMGGAYVAVADGLRAAIVNPAGLTLVPQAEASASTAPIWVAATVGKGFRDVRAALYWTRTEARATSLEGLASATGFDERGAIDSHGAELGAAVGWRWKRLRVGGSGALAQYSFTGTHSVVDGTGATRSTHLAVSGNRPFWGTVGVLLDLHGHNPRHRSALRAAVAYRFPRDWDADRGTVTLGTPPVAVANGVSFRQPASWAMGISLRALRGVLGTQGFLLAFEADRPVLEGLLDNIDASRRSEPGAFDFQRDWDVRGGAELDFGSPIGGVLKARVGAGRTIPAHLRYSGADPRLRALFPTDSDATDWVIGGGGSLIVEYMEKGMRLDVDVTGLDAHAQGMKASVGLVLRF